jgi:hypothetical protein
MAHHNRYWSCSKFAEWLRGTEKPKAATGKGWREWEEQAKVNYPVRYWLAEEGLDYIQDFVTYPIRKIYDLKYYINNRWVTHTHALTAHPRDIKRGQWCDVGNRFLPCLFNELVEFVEVELAWWHIAWSDKAEKQKYNAPFWATGWFRWRTWRCKQAGLDNLEWQMNLRQDESYGLKEGDEGWNQLTRQAINAKEIFELYKWWTEVYPKRPDPHDAGGWSEYCELRRKNGHNFFDLEDRTPEEHQMASAALDKVGEIEEAYKKEDEEMMIRLIKIRDSLWT